MICSVMPKLKLPGRFVSMENLGAVVVFLCSPAGADITGSVLPVDGGWLAG
jgi:3-hydroxybutyrate dehydrogenase